MSCFFRNDPINSILRVAYTFGACLSLAGCASSGVRLTDSDSGISLIGRGPAGQLSPMEVEMSLEEKDRVLRDSIREATRIIKFARVAMPRGRQLVSTATSYFKLFKEIESVLSAYSASKKTLLGDGKPFYLAKTGRCKKVTILRGDALAMADSASKKIGLCPGFFNRSLMRRAQTIVHETTHLLGHRNEEVAVDVEMAAAIFAGEYPELNGYLDRFQKVKDRVGELYEDYHSRTASKVSLGLKVSDSQSKICDVPVWAGHLDGARKDPYLYVVHAHQGRLNCYMSTEEVNWERVDAALGQAAVTATIADVQIAGGAEGGTMTTVTLTTNTSELRLKLTCLTPGSIELYVRDLVRLLGSPSEKP